MFLPMFVVDQILFGIGFGQEHGVLMLCGVTIAAVGCMFFVTFRAKDAMVGVEINEGGIFVLNERGSAFRGTEYRHVRNLGVRTLCITQISSDSSKIGFERPISGMEVKIIMVYIDGAQCFDDLKLEQLARKGKSIYWCDELFYHPNCIAFAYNEGAWCLLQKHSCRQLRAELDGFRTYNLIDGYAGERYYSL